MSSTKTYPIHTYSFLEEQLNIWSHFAGVIFSGVALVLLLVKAFRLDDVWTFVSFPIYGASMLILYLASTLYHSSKKPKIRYRLNILDHASIYLFIAGSYTPFVLVTLQGKEGWIIFAVAWATVAFAIPLTLTLFNKTKVLQMILYLALGWMIIVCIKTLWGCFDHTGIYLLIWGGVAYTLGAIIYGIGAKKRYFHSVFHFFVLAGSILHFLSLFMYVFVK